jgi:hypothetical protein
MALTRHTLFARCTHKLIDYSEPIRCFSLTTLASRLVSCSLNNNTVVNQQQNWIPMPAWLLLEQMCQLYPRVDWRRQWHPFHRTYLQCAMDDVEIGDVAMAYDDPYTGVTYILVMRMLCLFLRWITTLFLPSLFKRLDNSWMKLPNAMCLLRLQQITPSLILIPVCTYTWSSMGYSHTFSLVSWPLMRWSIGKIT